MITKFVVRLLDRDNTLLSWAEVAAVPAPQSGRASCPFWPSAVTRFVIEQSGVIATMAVHWTDLDIARTREMAETPVEAGQVFDFTWIEPVWLVAGMSGVLLPPVTVRAPVVAQPPAGSLVAKGTRL
jgi:hypothetical protein